MLYEILIFLIVGVCLICCIYKKRRHNLKSIIDAPEEIIITNNAAKVPTAIEKSNPITLQITEVESRNSEKRKLISDRIDIDNNENAENNENTTESELKTATDQCTNKSSKSQYDETTLSILTEELQNIYHDAAIDLLMDDDF